MTRPDDMVSRILHMRLEHLVRGCLRLFSQLQLEDISASSPAVPTILIKALHRAMSATAASLQKDRCLA
jgi:hypothetical protein